MITYAGGCADALSVLNYLCNECKVGTECGLMVVARCWVMEKGGDYKGCERVFEEALGEGEGATFFVPDIYIILQCKFIKLVHYEYQNHFAFLIIFNTYNFM